MREEGHGLGRLAVQLGLITHSQLEECLMELARSPHKTMRQVLTERGLVSHHQMEDLERSGRLYLEETREFKIDPALLKDMPRIVREKLGNPDADIGRYVLLEKIAQGGTGSVYRAWQKDLRRIVAVKFLESQDESYIKRFQQEAQVLARFDHANIAKVYEVGKHNGRHFIAMQYIEGHSLDQLKLDVTQTLHVIIKAAWAIQHAHNQGVIHRDVKPHNIMVDRRGQVYVLDFGLAKRVAGREVSITVTGELVGTPPYMSPEQVNGLPLDHRTDVYSLGATLYRMLTGRPPHLADDPIETLLRVRDEEPAYPSQLNRRIDRELEGIVMKALAKDRNRRYQSCEELAADLERYLKGGKILARPVRLPEKILRRIGLKRIGIAAALLATAFGGVVIVSTIESSRVRQHLSAGDAAMRDGKYLEAAAIYREALKLKPGDPAILAKIAAAEAEQQRRLDQIREQTFLQFKQTALALARDHEFDTALFYCQEALKFHPNDVECLQTRDFCSTERQKRLAALVHREVAARLRLHGDEYKSRGLYDLAAAFYEQALKLDRDPAVDAALRDCRGRIKPRDDPQKRREEHEAIIFSALKSAARDMFSRTRFAEALEVAQLADSLGPGDPEIQQIIREARELHQRNVRNEEVLRVEKEAEEAFRQERYHEAQYLYEWARRLLPDNPKYDERISQCRRNLSEREATDRFELFRRRAIQKYESEDWHAALALIHEALRWGQDARLETLRDDCLGKIREAEIDRLFGAYQQAGGEAFARGEWLRALLAYEEARKLKPKDPAMQEAIRTCLKKLGEKKTTPEQESVEYLVHMGDAAYGRKDYDAALTYYDKALELRPNDPQIKNKKAVVEYARLQEMKKNK